jgi:hypothetical protein
LVPQAVETDYENHNFVWVIDPKNKGNPSAIFANSAVKKRLGEPEKSLTISKVKDVLLPTPLWLDRFFYRVFFCITIRKSLCSGTFLQGSNTKLLIAMASSFSAISLPGLPS